MKKTTTVKIPEAYWETPEGGKLYEVMHHDGWEGLDCLNSVIDALGQAIEVTADANIKAELEKSREQILQSRNSYRKAAARLRNIF